MRTVAPLYALLWTSSKSSKAVEHAMLMVVVAGAATEVNPPTATSTTSEAGDAPYPPLHYGHHIHTRRHPRELYNETTSARLPLQFR